MRFLLEAADKYNTIAEAKAVEEKENGVRYNDLDRNSEFDFINHVLDRLNNSDNLQQARDTYIDIIREKGWDSSRNPIIPFIEKIPKDLSSSIVELISELIDDRKIDISRDSGWLLNSSLYNRRIEDQAYSIKALVLASNPRLQQDKHGKNKFNSNNKYLTPQDLLDNNNILSVKDIKDVLDTWQDISSSQSSELNEVELDAISALMNMKTSKQDAIRYVRQLYTPQDTVQSLVFKVLQSSGASK